MNTEEQVSEAYAKKWRDILKARLKRRRVVGAEDNLNRLAVLLAELGSPYHAHPLQIFETAEPLLLILAPQRTLHVLPSLTAALNLLPGKESLLHVAFCLDVWKAATGRNPRSERFRPDTVIATMLQVPTPEPYVRHLHSKGWSSLAQMWHPNTLEGAKKDPHLRGTFGGTPDYWARTHNDLVVVSEEE